MTPGKGVSRMAEAMLGSTNGGLLATLVPIMTGAMVASAVIALIRQDHSRLGTTLREQVGGTGEKTLEELLAEKEHLEDLIAEAAARQSGK